MNFGEINKVILLGGGLLLMKVAKLLKDKLYDVVIVSSNRLFSSQMEEFCLKENIQFVLSDDVNKDNKMMDLIDNNTLGISIGAPWIFRKKSIDLFKGKLVNLHGSRLPKDRGGGGFSWRVMKGDKQGCSLIHLVDEGIDTGRIIVADYYSFPEKCVKPVHYYDYSICRYIEIIDLFIREITSGKTFTLQTQQNIFSTYWPRLSTEIHGYIDWSWSCKEIKSFIDAFGDPYSGSSTYINNTKVHIKDADYTTDDGLFHPFQKGIVYRKSNVGLFVAGEDGSIIIKNVFTSHGNNYIDSVTEGDRFYTPSELLEKAKQLRVYYKADSVATYIENGVEVLNGQRGK